MVGGGQPRGAARKLARNIPCRQARRLEKGSDLNSDPRRRRVEKFLGGFREFNEPGPLVTPRPLRRLTRSRLDAEHESLLRDEGNSLERRNCNEYQAANQSGLCGRQLERYPGTLVNTHHVNLAQPQVSRQIGDRQRRVLRQVRRSCIGLPESRQIRRIDRSICSNLRQKTGKRPARSRCPMEANQRHLFIKAAGGRECRTNVKLPETAIEVRTSRTYGSCLNLRFFLLCH